MNYLNGRAESLEEECKRYADLLTKYPVDIVCLGIGENGHIAFNDPDVADFNDPKLVKNRKTRSGMPSTTSQRKMLRKTRFST